MARRDGSPTLARADWLGARGGASERFRTWDTNADPAAQQARWQGESLADRRVLVNGSADFGDTVQFIRFAAPLRRIARETRFRVPRPLMDVVREVPGVDHVLALHDGGFGATVDLEIDITELPTALGIDAASLGTHIPYVARSALLARRLTRDRDRRRRPCVGIAWRAGDIDHDRNLPTSALHRLTASHAARFHSLQYGVYRPPPRTLDVACLDLRELTRRMARLDLVIAVDCVIAHLAGAMGLPVWTLLTAHCDARWSRGRDDSPWYPTMRLFRQTADDDWMSVVERVSMELAEFARKSLVWRTGHSRTSHFSSRIASSTPR